MYIFENTGRRCDIRKPYHDEESTKDYDNLLSEELRQKFGVVEIPDPVAPAPHQSLTVQETYEITELDSPPYVTYVRKTDAQIADARWARIKIKRDELTATGGCLVEGKWYHSDTHSKVQQLALVVAGANLPQGIQWKTMDGSFVEMTPELATSLYSAQMTQEQAIFARAETLKTDPAADINEGWPEVYKSPEELAAETALVTP